MIMMIIEAIMVIEVVRPLRTLDGEVGAIFQSLRITKKPC